MCEVQIYIPSSYSLNSIKTTPSFKYYLSDDRLDSLKVGSNSMIMSEETYSRLRGLLINVHSKIIKIEQPN